jgi:hypothetical protein
MNMMDHIRRSMKGEPSPPKLNEIKSLGEKPIAIAPQPISSVDAKIKALIESKKQQMNEIMEAPLGKETTGAPVPSMDNFSVKGKGKPKIVNAKGNVEDDGQEQVELGGVTPVDLEPETKDVTPKDLRKEGFLSSALSSLAAKSLPKKATPHIAAAHDAFVKGDKDFTPAKSVKGGLGAAGKFIAKKIGAHVANELGKTVGISGSTITGTVSALASGGAKKMKAAKAGKSTTAMSASTKPPDDGGHTPPPNPMSAGKSKKSPNVKGATAGGGEPERKTPDEYRNEMGLPPRGKAKPGTAPESSTSKGATLMSKDSLFKQKSTNNDKEKPAHQPKFDKGGSHTTMSASPGEYGKKLNKEFPIPPHQPKTSNNPMSAKSKSSSGSTNRISSNLKNRMMSSAASASTASNPMSAKPSSMSAKMSSGVGALDRFKNANRMKIKKINEELSELVKLIEWQNRFKQLPAMETISAEDHLDKMVHHHNKGLEAKAAGDKTRAIVHFNTRDHHFAWYFKKAPEADSNRLDLPKIRAMLDVKEDITPLDKVMEIRRRIAA